MTKHRKLSQHSQAPLIASRPNAVAVCRIMADIMQPGHGKVEIPMFSLPMPMLAMHAAEADFSE